MLLFSLTQDWIVGYVVPQMVYFLEYHGVSDSLWRISDEDLSACVKLGKV